MGVHSERLAASKAHRRFDGGIKAALRRMGGSVPSPSEISPIMIGAKPLSFAAPTMMEEALGYRGALRFVAFGYFPRTRRFGHCDGGDDIPTDSGAWHRFLHHSPVAMRVPESGYPTLYGVFKGKPQPSLQRVLQPGNQRGKASGPVHCLLLDRETRQLYICRRDQAIVFFSLVEADEKEASRVFIDGLRVSVGDENFKVPPSPELAVQLLSSIDEQLETTST